MRDPRKERAKQLEEERAIRAATRKLLFGDAKREMPGAGEAADKTPERHLRQKVTMNLDGDLIAFFKERGERMNRPYQLLINEALREYIEGNRVDRLARDDGQRLVDDESFLALLAERLK